MMPRTRALLRAVIVSLLLCLSSLATPAFAQDSTCVGANAECRITGSVVDARTGRVLAQTVVSLLWLRPLVTPGDARFTRFQRADRITLFTDHRGYFAFDNLVNGDYKVVVYRGAYHIDTLGVSIRNSFLNLGFELEPEATPTALDPVRVAERPLQSFRIPDSRYADSLGLRALYLSEVNWSHVASDVEALTARDIAEAIPLAEPDPFRALQRRPGVGTRDDYTASLWTRGAPWDQTRIYFDGLPLYNPTHAGWLFSSINPEGIGEAFYMPGMRPSWIGEGAAGVLDMRSREGGIERDFEGSVDLSMVSVRASASGLLPSNIGSGMLALRRTYIDVLTAAMQSVGGRDPRIPYDFSDAIARFDFNLPRDARLEISGIYERDQLRGDFPGVLSRNEASWGNRAGQGTIVVPVGPVELRASAGRTRFGTRLLELVDDSEEPEEDPTLPSLENALTHTAYALEARSRTSYDSRVSWRAGVQRTSQRAAHDGPFSLTAEGVPGVDRDDVIRIPFLYESELHTDALWGQLRFDLASRLAFDVGVRAERGRATIANAANTRFAPRLAGRVVLDSASESFVTAAWSRGYQYAQDVGAAAGPLGPQLHLTHIWQLASAGVPALKSTVATFGIERRINAGLFASLNVYERVSTGVTIPDPTPGEIRADRPLFQVAENDARGVEGSLRYLKGDWSAMFGAAISSSRMRALGMEFSSPADVQRTVDATIAHRLNESWRLSGAFSYASGVPYTRLIIGESALRLGEPYAQRTPAYASADLSVDYAHSVGTRQFSAYLQLRNVFNRQNQVTYSGSPERCVGGVDGSGVCAGSLIVTDRFDAGIPVLPLLGVRFVF